MLGIITKMKTRLEDVVQYSLPIGDQELALNPLIGQTLSLRYTGNIVCDSCGRKTKKSFAQGHCFPCMQKLASCDMCIMKPETCHYHLGTCREPSWGDAHCMVDHVVYLANTSGMKVGITRATQIPTRWMDQGATQALPIFKVQTRQISGLVEVALAKNMADKTNWRAMLKGDNDKMDLTSRAQDAIPRLGETLAALEERFGSDAVERLKASTVEINYPVTQYPTKIVSFNFDKNPLVEGTLMGIKGQYLMFDTGVINLRKFTSYELEVNH
jgi:hypothetical protein